MPTAIAVRNEATESSTTISEEPTDDSAVSEADRTSASGSWQPFNPEHKWHSVKRVYARLEHGYDRLVADKWAYEIFGILVYASTLLTIVAVLLAYRNRPSPRIMVGVSVRTMKASCRISMINDEIAQHRHLHTGYVL
jgi:hypothetical protein